MSQKWLVPVVVAGLLAGTGWHFREPLKARLDSLMQKASVQDVVSGEGGSASTEADGKETVYRWVDENGVSHFDQRPHDGGQAVVIDQSRIQSMDSLDAPEVDEAGNPVVSLPQPEGRTGPAGTIPRYQEKLQRAEDRFEQTRQEYIP
jgi:hypothetical protein